MIITKLLLQDYVIDSPMNPILKKQLSIKYQGSENNYQLFKRTLGASPLLYQHDYNFYNDNVQTRHKRNTQEIKYILKLLASNKIGVDMLRFNTFNSFYPSYVLHQHYNIFIPILQKIAKQSDSIKYLLNASNKNQIIGAFLQEKQRWDLKNSSQQIPTLSQKGHLQMNELTYFYSPSSSPYITHAAFIVKHEKSFMLAIVEVRNEDGSWKNIKVKDFGGTISQDYLPVGFNFAGAKPIAVVEISQSIYKQIRSLNQKNSLFDFQQTLKDLQKSLWVSVKYTTMRKQFKTIQGSKEERSIITYQGVVSRIVDGFTTMIGLSDLNSRLHEQEHYFLIFSQLLKASHHVVLEKLMHLRQTCGGYGFMQYSGHPGCIERVAFRAGQDQDKELDFTPLFLQATQHKFFIVNRSQMKQYLICTFLAYFYQQAATCEIIEREYLKQCSIMAMHGRQDWSKHDASNVHCKILQYAVSKYILDNLSFVNWDLVKIQKVIFYNGLNNYNKSLLQNINESIQLLGQTLELQYLRNTIVGQDQAQFYAQLLTVSRNNLRNDKDYVEYIRHPIVEMLSQARSKL